MNTALISLLAVLFLVLLLVFALGSTAAMFRHPADAPEGEGEPAKPAAGKSSVRSADHAVRGIGFDTPAGLLSASRGSRAPRDPRI